MQTTIYQNRIAPNEALINALLTFVLISTFSAQNFVIFNKPEAAVQQIKTDTGTHYLIEKEKNIRFIL